MVHMTRGNTWRHKISNAGFAATIYHLGMERNVRRHNTTVLTVEQRFGLLKREVLGRIKGQVRCRSIEQSAYLLTLSH